MGLEPVRLQDYMNPSYVSLGNGLTCLYCELKATPKSTLDFKLKAAARELSCSLALVANVRRRDPPLGAVIP